MLRITLLLLLLAGPARAQRVSLWVHADDQRISLSHDSLPTRFGAAHPLLAQALRWRVAQPGLSWAELELRAGALRIPVRAIIARIDPRAFDFDLQLMTRANGMTGAWNVDSTTATAAIAFNAGQFKETGPWGWLVLKSRERRTPGYGPLSVGIAFDTSGAVRWIPAERLAAARADRSIQQGFQSYPLLLYGGAVPKLVAASDDVDRGHRDARLVLGQLRDRSLIVVLTRYDALGGLTQRVPIGLTLPESLALIGALGAEHAVMLDGGVSAQLLLREAGGEPHIWRGLRSVPLALVLSPRRR